ncbi:MBL fold metallo-hydrolase [Dyadobacter sp. CY323]|uniref:MBL fold metallo-hydrolase n=1 Tax=Dyadobacter sp. CY323 TaxID=2907302 RepID=UPI001F270D4B|nr:3',5'-cyclic-nucleotide phosphodiesterase [Dyadobacter sp. CY323]MCE6992843.1 3',5'-cyclic-nucleotide phosphodiesterase [Dyadobacter sp. CY323]
MRISFCLAVIILVFNSFSFGQNGFRVVPLGVKGGGDDGNLSAYMVAPNGSNNYVCLDAGTVSHGIAIAISQKAFSVPQDEVLRKYIKAYFISHPHLDHLSGMIINSVDDSTKNVYGFEHCIETIKTHYFNWQSWPNLGNEGAAPALKKYKYNVLVENQSQPIDHTGMSVQAFRLSHSNPYESAAFLIKSGESYLLYFGDTGPDEVEKGTNLENVWRAVTPLVRDKKLKGVFLEVSYPNSQPDRQLYGHLTPAWFMKELGKLENLAGKGQLKNLNVIVTHIKPTGNNEQTIKSQLNGENPLGINLIYPEQGVSINLN